MQASNLIKPKFKYWYGGDILISLSLLSSLLFANYCGDWGLMQTKTFPILLQALIIYFFSELMPLKVLFATYIVYIAITSFLAFTLFTNMFLLSGYFIGLLIAIILLKKLSWKLKILIPLIIHIVGAFFLAFIFIFQKKDLSNYVLAVKALSQGSIICELLFIYPLIYCSKYIAKLTNWCKWLE